MDKNIVAKVLKKLGEPLPETIGKLLPKLAEELKKDSAEDCIKTLVSFRNANELSDAQYGEVLNRLIDLKIYLKDDGKVDTEKRVELKKITEHPPVKIYFDRTY